MDSQQLPLWVEIVVSVFALLAGLVAVIAASGVLRLNSFFARVHAPALVTTVGIWCIMIAALVFFAAKQGNFQADIFLIGLFISVTTPVTTIFLMRAALFRARQRGEAVPSSVNVLKLAQPQTAPQEDEPDEEFEQLRAQKRKALLQSDSLQAQESESPALGAESSDTPAR